jgi:hypothetical protein
MTVDPTDPDTFAEGDQGRGITPDGLGIEELDQEVPEADAAEQHTAWQQRGDDPPTRIDKSSANEADAAEQARAVTIDEDDYR